MEREKAGERTTMARMPVTTARAASNKAASGTSPLPHTDYNANTTTPNTC